MDTMTSRTEGATAREIESQTSKLPSDLFLFGALTLLGASFMLFTLRQKHSALMLGQVVAPILIMGLYNKLVKQAGHDYLDRQPD